ncbi:MAG TPA: LamG-like jellyroll fold domain-containing protein, partial [Acidimicrobiales bacterium]|nr:LamG-like jellyroll fold domain-containing protein [Acidimicrobiales bacterium]
QASSGATPGPVGYGWSYNLGMSLAQDPATGDVTLHQEDGSEVSFSPYVAGASPSWCSAGFNYCSDAPRVLATLEQNADGSWTLTRHVGGAKDTFDFSSSGVLVSEADQAGDQIVSSATAPGAGACPATASACTTWTSSASGRSLTLAFDAAGQLTSVSDEAGNTVSYCYYGQACANGASSGGPEDLYSAAVPGTGTTTYSYASSNTNPALAHDITSESLPGGASVTNTFDASGRVTSQAAPTDVVSLAYQGDNQSVPGGTTTVSTWPSGTVGKGTAQVAQYSFSSGALVAQTTAYGTPDAATSYFDLDPNAVDPVHVQDPNGNVSSEALAPASDGPMAIGNVISTTDALGNTTQSEYNADNQPWCSVGAGEYLAGVRCPGSQPSAPPAPGAADPWAGATISFYDAQDNLVASTDPLGRTTTYSYTPSGLSVPAGLQYCSVAPVSYAAGVTCPAYGAPAVAGTTSSTFDAAGDVTSTTDPDGATTTTAYTDPAHPGLPTVTMSPDGDVTTEVYNSAGQVTSSTLSFGSYKATTLYAYDSAGRLYCTVAPQQVAQGITCPSTPPSASSPPAGVSSTFYDTSGNVVQTTGPNGGTSVSAYDAAGRVWCSVAPPAYEKGVRCPATEPATAPSAGKGPYLGATITTYNSSGQMAAVTSPLGAVTSSTYDAAGNLVSQTVSTSEANVPAVTTSYTYDADGQQVSETVAPGSARAATTLSYYDPDGNVYCSVSADAYAAADFSCPTWQASWVSAPPAVGSLYSATPSASQADNVTTNFYDADGELLQSTSPDKGTSISVYDANGETVCAETPSDMVSTLASQPGASYPYGCPSAPLATPPATGSNPGYETTIYDAAGHVLSSTDAAGDTTSYTYDNQGQVLTTTGPSGQVTTNCYYWQVSECAAGAPAGGGDASALYSTTMPPGASSPQGATVSYTYLPGGAASTTTNAAGTQSDSYDTVGQLSSVSYSSPAPGYSPSAPVSYSYDSAGQKTSMTDGTGTTTYSYDTAGDLVSESFTPTAPACYVCVVGQGATVSGADSSSLSVGGPMAVSSSSPASVVASGTAKISAAPLELAGGSSSAANGAITGATTSVVPVPGNVIPLLPAPVLTGTAQSISLSGASVAEANPGVYSSLALKGTSSLHLAPGTYVVTGGISVSGNAQLAGTGVAIYLACASYPSPCASAGTPGASVSVSGNATLALSGMGVGRASDVAIYADAANNGGISVTGSGVANLAGSLDLPSGALSASGNASISVSSAIVAVSSLSTAGSSDVVVDSQSAPSLTGTTTSYSYYSTGQLASETYPYAPNGAGGAVTYGYDARGELSSQTDWAGRTIAYSYDADGNLVSTSYPNGVNVANTYDRGDAMTGLSATSGGGSLAGAKYSLDSAEQLTNQTDSGALAASGQPSTSYSYDSADRLGSVTQTSTSKVSYDPSGDPVGLADGTTQVFDKASELLSSTNAKGTSTVYSYTSVGERASYSAGNGAYANYGYDQAGQMTSAALAAPGGTYPAAVLADGPVAYWRLDDPAGSSVATDATGAGHNLGVVGNVGLGSTGALAGDKATSATLGAGSYLTGTASTLPDFSGKSAFSIEGWLSPSVTDGSQRAVVSKFDATGSGYELFVTAGQVGLERCASGACSTVVAHAALPVPGFTYVAATYDGKVMRIYE